MATRSMIGIVRADGSVRAIYCHFDGYLEGVGATLHKHYFTETAVYNLLDLGSISSLGDSLSYTTTIDDTFDNEFKDIAEAVEYYTPSWCEYFYIFEDGIWTVRDRHGMNRSLAGVLEDLRESVKE